MLTRDCLKLAPRFPYKDMLGFLHEGEDAFSIELLERERILLNRDTLWDPKWPSTLCQAQRDNRVGSPCTQLADRPVSRRFGNFATNEAHNVGYCDAA